MRTLLVLVFLFPFEVFAKVVVSRIDVSQTFSIEIPLNIVSKADLPSLNMKYLKLRLNETTTPELYLLHERPKTIANKFSVERYWNESRRQTKDTDKNEKNSGCSRLTITTYRCHRSVGQNGKFVSESLYWNSKSDLVLLRVSALSSFEQTEKVLRTLKINQVSRLPAGGKE